MCGLAGFLDRGTRPANLLESVRRMAETVRHRGPDDRGEWVDETSGLALGFRRLAIVDLSDAGHQPMASRCGRYVLIFNGEIYNFSDVRRLLERDGHAGGWRGHSDTEVFLAAVSRWGLRGALAASAGMFALALWDAQERTLSLVRDRLGKKPLYYGWSGDTFLFGSELKVLRAFPGFSPSIDRASLRLFFQYGYVPAPRSIYAGVLKLPAGHILTIRAAEPAGRPGPVAYWSLREVVTAGRRDPFVGSDEEAEARLEQVLGDAVGQRMISDVPLGAFLSGGIDSSTVVALMQARSHRPVKTFTIGFRESDYDEAGDARRVANCLGSDHTEIYVTPDEARAVIPTLPSCYDEPFADSSQIPTLLISRLARTSVTVSLSGDGGDEVFGGYNRYVWAPRFWGGLRRVPLPFRRALADVLDRPGPSSWAASFASLGRATHRGFPRLPAEKMAKIIAILPARSREDLYRILVSQWDDSSNPVLMAPGSASAQASTPPVPALDAFACLMMFLDHVTYLPDDILVKLDRASMSVSLEARCPFLDHRVVEFAWTLPLDMKVRRGAGKFIVRRLLARHVPPTLTDRPKMGFGVPMDTWLRGPLRAWADDLLGPGRLDREAYLDSRIVGKAWADHRDGRRNNAHSLWCALMFESWLAATHA